MNSTTRTGLIPTPKRSLHMAKKRKSLADRLPAKFEAQPMALSLRPFGGLYNPFAKGCSVLCNHPAPTAVKDIIHQFKCSLATEGKHPATSRGDKVEAASLSMPLHDNIPEDLFRRYTDTDSRPLTPTPTVTSIHTRTSAGSFLNRRCITPELGKTDIIKRKKIILDLRRSHSQETLCWKPCSDLSQTLTDLDSSNKPKSASAIEDKKPKRPKSTEQRSKSSLGTAHIPIDVPEEEIKKPLVTSCINEHDLGDEDVRRGKKRKKLKMGAGEAKPSATFHLSEDPETQVAALGPDSMNPSTRPSLIPNSVSLLPNREKRDSENLLKGSFLTDEAFKALKTELDVDAIENTFGRHLNRALREAIKYLPPRTQPVREVEEITKRLGMATLEEDSTKMPRKFSKSATRFEVPMNLESLANMTVLEYLSKFVSVSRQRKQLYKRVFVKYVKTPVDSAESQTSNAAAADANNGDTESESDQQPQLYGEYVERLMGIESLPKALEDALEFYGTAKNVEAMLHLLDIEQFKSRDLNFRALCGIVAFAERLAVVDDPECTDSCDELEKADFSSMEQRLEKFEVPPTLRKVLEIIRKTQMMV